MAIKDAIVKAFTYTQTDKGLRNCKRVATGLQIFGVIATGTGALINGYTNRIDQKLLIEEETSKMESTFVSAATDWLNSAESRIVDAKIHRAVRDELAALDPNELQKIWEEAANG